MQSMHAAGRGLRWLQLAAERMPCASSHATDAPTPAALEHAWAAAAAACNALKQPADTSYALHTQQQHRLHWQSAAESAPLASGKFTAAQQAATPEPCQLQRPATQSQRTLPCSPQPGAAAAMPQHLPAAHPGTLAAPARGFSNQPETAVYSGPTTPSPKRFTLRQLRAKYRTETPITMVTAYDYPSAVHVERAGIDLLLVGDSAAMVVHGHDTTLPITLDDMLSHCRAVARGARRPLLVGDLPFGSYEGGPRDAVAAAVRMMKEGGMDAVKLEGGGPARIQGVRAIVDAGIAVMGHTGLMPQTISVLGGFRPQAQSAASALSVLRDAKALEQAGCFSIVLECVPAAVAAAVTAEVKIPTIGIGAGAGCSGQVLVYHDLLGMMQHPHHAKVTPKFCKQYGAVGEAVQQALGQYREEVEERAFPSEAFSPYRISDDHRAAAAEAARAEGFTAAAAALAAADDVQMAGTPGST